MRVSDYIAKFLVEHGVRDVFTVTGGGAMYLNDSFGHYTPPPRSYIVPITTTSRLLPWRQKPMHASTIQSRQSA